MSFESLALLIDTYWMFLAVVLVAGTIVGWIATDMPAPEEKVH